MKRSICCLVVFVFALGMQANGKNGIKMDDRRGMCVPADVEKGWQKRTIKVPGKKSDIVTLFEAFYKVWYYYRKQPYRAGDESFAGSEE